MSYFYLGNLIRKTRKEKGLSQEELAFGIIEPGNLSRIENGNQFPTKPVFDALIQRLGLNAEKYSTYFLNERDFEIFEKRNELTRCFVSRRVEETLRLIEELEGMEEFKKGLHLQFLLSVKAAIMMRNQEDSKAIAGLLKKALEISIPEFAESNIGKYILTGVEVDLINMIALVYANEMNFDYAIEIFYSLKDSIDGSCVDSVEKAKHYQLVLYNLSKYLGLAQRYHEAIEICDIAKKVCLDKSKLEFLPKIIFNKAYCLIEMGDFDSCKRLIYQAYYGCDMLEKYKEKEKIKAYAKEKLGIDL